MLFDYCVLSSIIRNMLKKIILLLITLILFSACNHKEEIYIPVNQEEEEIKEEIVLTKEEEILNSMTLEEKIGQLFIVRYENIDDEDFCGECVPCKCLRSTLIDLICDNEVSDEDKDYCRKYLADKFNTKITCEPYTQETINLVEEN